MDKIALVNHRYGLEVTGGSELECRILAKKLKKFYDVEVLTTCAIDDSTWANYYEEGLHIIEGIKVRRFSTEHKRIWIEYNERLEQMLKDKEGHLYEDELQWIMDQGPYAPMLFDYIHQYYSSYKAIIFMTYLYYTGSVCMLGIPNALFIPTAHNEKPIYLSFYQRVFEEPQGLLFNTYEEKEFVENLFSSVATKPSIVGVYGVDLKRDEDYVDIKEKFNLTSPYIMYAGRITPAKGCDEIVEYFIKYKERNSNNLKLVLIGKKDMEIPDSKDILFLGFVTEEEKLALMKMARLFVIGSHFESLSIVVLEALSQGTPVLVTEKSDVLKGHVIRSNAGYYYGNFEEFENAINNSLEDTKEYLLMAKNGRKYIEYKYDWDKILNSMIAIIEDVKYKPEAVKTQNVCDENNVYINRIIEPAYSEKNIAVVFATDDNYVPVLSVALQAVIDNASKEENYDIIVLSDQVNANNREKLNSMTKELGNFSLRYVEVSDKLDSYSFKFNNTNLSRATFMRLLIPDLFSAYERVVYLDCDTTILRDIALLYKTDLYNNIIGAIRDPHIIEVWKFRPEIKAHILQNVKLESPNDYFNAGVLLIDVKKLREKYTSEQLLDIAISKKWMWEDQDVLNYALKGQVCYLDAAWNVFWVNCPRIQQMMKTNVSYLQALKNPKLIHYAAGAMPFNRPEEIYSDIYWAYARKSPFYELLIKRMNISNIPIINSTVQPEGNIVFRKAKGFFRNLFAYGGSYTFKLTVIYLKSLFLAEKGKRHKYIQDGAIALQRNRK